MAARANGCQPPAVLNTGAAVMDMRPTSTFAASDTQTPIPRENGIALSAEPALGIRSGLAAAAAGASAAAEWAATPAEQTSLPAVQDRMRHGTLYLATA